MSYKDQTTLFWQRVAEKRYSCSYIPDAGEKNEKTKKKKGKKKRKKEKKRKKKGEETYLLNGAPLESFEPEVRRAPLTPLPRPWEGASAQLRRGATTVHRVRLRLGAPFTTMNKTHFKSFRNITFPMVWLRRSIFLLRRN